MGLGLSAPPLPTCVTSMERLPLSEPQFPYTETTLKLGGYHSTLHMGLFHG